MCVYQIPLKYLENHFGSFNTLNSSSVELWIWDFDILRGWERYIRC